MYRKDYILTMIEELAQFLGRLVFLKETRRFDVALAEIDEFCGRLFERNTAQLRMMSVEEILAYAKEGDEGDDIRKRVALGNILKELGDIAGLNGNQAEEEDFHAKALGILLDVYGSGDIALPLETPERIEMLVACTAGRDLPPSVARLLFAYLEIGGFYADAEDLLFEILHNGQADMLDEGIAFYERLLMKDAVDLSNGNLPREEVQEGLQELRERRG